VISIFQSFHQMILTQFNTRVQVLRSDNGGEYFKKELSAYFHAYGIIHQTSCVDTPQQNGVAERKNLHLLEVARSLLFAMNVPKSFWGDAVLTAAYLISECLLKSSSSKPHFNPCPRHILFLLCFKSHLKCLVVSVMSISTNNIVVNWTREHKSAFS
jgi:transposase InsO family protein